MTPRETPNTNESFESAVRARTDARYVLKLYIAGATPVSVRATQNLHRLIEEYLPERYELEVIDIYQTPTLAEGEQIIAAPTLVKQLPLPIRRFIGDLSNTDRLLVGLDLKPK